MKHEIGVELKAHFTAPWPNAYKIFSWLEYAVSIPYPTYLITTLKENGKPNACWHSWGCFSGEGQGYYAVMSLNQEGHTYQNILRRGEWCINLPSMAQQEQCYKTIAYNSIDDDEITAAGFTVELAQVVAAPRIAECPVNLECALQWHKPLFEGSRQHIFVGKIVHLAMDERVCAADPQQRLTALNIMFNVRSTLDPLTGEICSGTVGIIRLA